MAACNICTKDLVSPVCIPCGHVFCNDCILRAIRAIAPLTTMHHCPACETPYSTAALDPVSVPPHLRANLLPAIRKIHFSGASEPAQSSSSTDVDLQTENARLRAENAALQKNCAMWRKRAEAHSSSTLGLLQLMRLTRDQTTQVTRQRDELRRKCQILQTRLYGEDIDDEEDNENDDDLSVGSVPPSITISWTTHRRLGTGEEPFLPSTLLSQVDKQRTSDSPLSVVSLSSSPNSLGPSSLKRVRTPYDSPCNSESEDDERPQKRPRRVSLSPLPGI